MDFVRGHYLFDEEQTMYKDKYSSIFSPQMKANVFITDPLNLFRNARSSENWGIFGHVTWRVLMDDEIINGQRDWHKLRPGQLSRDGNLVLIIELLNTKRTSRMWLLIYNAAKMDRLQSLSTQ